MVTIDIPLSLFHWTEGMSFMYLDKNDYFVGQLVRTVRVTSHVTGKTYDFNRFETDSIFYPSDKNCPVKGLAIAETHYINRLIADRRKINGIRS